jgi:hypothetical protein
VAHGPQGAWPQPKTIAWYAQKMEPRSTQSSVAGGRIVRMTGYEVYSPNIVQGRTIELTELGLQNSFTGGNAHRGRLGKLAVESREREPSFVPSDA